jgi:hypothetical protein
MGEVPVYHLYYSKLSTYYDGVQVEETEVPVPSVLHAAQTVQVDRLVNSFYNTIHCVSRRRWCSDIMQDSHSCDPGSIPGRRSDFIW